MSRTPLTQAEIAARANLPPGWAVEGGFLLRTVKCTSFPAAMALVNRVAEAAEAADHHPDIDIRWRTVRLALRTHSAGGLTELDFQLAATLNPLIDSLSESQP